MSYHLPRFFKVILSVKKHGHQGAVPVFPMFKKEKTFEEKILSKTIGCLQMITLCFILAYIMSSYMHDFTPPLVVPLVNRR